jgi:hypothetical protein
MLLMSSTPHTIQTLPVPSDFHLLQGIKKQAHRFNDFVLKKLFVTYLASNPLGLSTPANAHYRSTEIHALLTSMNLSGRSAEHLKFHANRTYNFHYPDQQTVRVRLEKLTLAELEKNVNNALLNDEIAKKIFTLPFLRKLRRRKQTNITSVSLSKSAHPKRRKLRKNARVLQRDRGVKRPEGIYVSSDAQNIPYYGELDVELFSGENLQSYTVKDRAKQSTTKFYQFHTLYSFETGIRRIMGIHLTRRRLVDEHWQREPLAPILIYLLELWREKQPSIKGVIGDGAYYNLELIEYLQERKLDYVIRADMTSDLQRWCKEEGLWDLLNDGEYMIVYR